MLEDSSMDYDDAREISLPGASSSLIEARPSDAPDGTARDESELRSQSRTPLTCKKRNLPTQKDYHSSTIIDIRLTLYNHTSSLLKGHAHININTHRIQINSSPLSVWMKMRNQR
ncbi:uncharacterized protein LOC109859347 isoform X2 [Pseudomyrmex gracilis]|uniref:uncharacterized protein LOC109859347 isoform X2 n=1 Tax=Pseudomyrmex gracilis TaxID=219809 RepID=UPI000994C21A|nr:uncharacterized protein LOC109859347 isoform X2 [Pseudomyrmex gracilis]